MPKPTPAFEAEALSNPKGASDWLALVYDELRKLAAARMATEAQGQTLDPTGLVHEAYLRLIGNQQFDGQAHFFAAAAEAMRRVLIDRARSKARKKRSGIRQIINLCTIPNRFDDDPDTFIALNDALDRFIVEDAGACEVAKLHLLTGLSIEEIALVRGTSRATAYREWSYARAWLQNALDENP